MIVFDLDDTLYKEKDYVVSGFHAIGQELERNGVMDVKSAVGIIEEAVSSAAGFDELAARVREIKPEGEYGVEWLVETYRCHKPDISLSVSVKDTLDELKNRGFDIGLITDGRKAAQRAKISSLGLERYVAPENFIISEEIGADKTTRIPFMTIMERNRQEEFFVYIGDNPAKDFHWPNLMGWDTFMLIDDAGVNVHSQKIVVPDTYQAHYTIHSLAELLDFFR